MNVTRSIFHACLLPSLFTLVFGTMQPIAAAESRPNIVFFMVDDMGWMDSGVYGSKYYQTPHIDRFAQRSMRFTNAYAQPLCSPTRASLLSGQYSARHGVTTASGHQPPQPADHIYQSASAPADVPMLLPQSKNYLDPSQVTYAETFRNAGYRTAHIGKWHLGIMPEHWPEQQGFDVAFHCHPDPGPPGNYFSPYGVSAAGIPNAKNKIGTITDGPTGEYIVDRQAQEAVSFIRSSLNEPFLLNLWCYGVHGPWGHKPEYTESFIALHDPTGRQGNPIMASMLKSVDECFGAVLDELETQGIADNTIVIFYSDNGGNTHSNVAGSAKTAAAEKFKTDALADWRRYAGNQPPTMNTPLRDGKGTLYEGGTRVPLMWSWPGKIKPASTNDSIVGPIDFYPTLVDLVGIGRPSDQIFDGISYSNVLLGTGPLDREALFNYHPHAGLNRAGGVWVRKGDYKLLRWFGNPNTHELYNLSLDISEEHDLSTAEPERVSKLGLLIDQFLQQTGATYPRPNPAFLSSNEPKTNHAIDAWKQRGCSAKVVAGVLEVTGSGNPESAFLGHAVGNLIGPATVRMKIRGDGQMTGRIDCLPQGAAEPSQVISQAFPIERQWRELSVEIPHRGRLGVLRFYLPVSPSSKIEIDEIQIVPTSGRTESWKF